MRYEEYLAEEFRDPGLPSASAATGDPAATEPGGPAPAGVTRRDFLAALGAGIFVLFHWDDLAAAPGRGRGNEEAIDWNAFLRIAPDGRVTVFSGKVELGQGIHTSLAQTVAEELDLPLDAIEMVMGDTDLCPWDAGTFGSLTTRFHAPLLRTASAEARGILVQLAAEQWNLPPASLRVKEGRVFVAANPSRSLTYGRLARGRRIVRRLEPKPQPEDPGRYTLVGTSPVRRDAVAKVTGAAKYTGDIRLPGMLYARILRPPAHGARLVRADLSAVRGLPGIHVVEEDGLVAVLAEQPDRAGAALAQVKAEFTPGATEPGEQEIYDHLVRTAGEGRVAAEGGDLAAGTRASVEVFEQSYYNAYVAHAAMEPHTALVRIDGRRVTVWASTQRPFGCKEEVAQALGLPAENVRVLTPFVGGGFGGKSYNLQAVQAARLAKATGRPVQVAWTREDEFFYDTFRPAAVVQIRSGLDSDGRIVLWDYTVYNAGERGAPHFYTIPHHRTRGTSGRSPLPTGAWRAPGNNTNTFAREQQIDLMAARAGVDPVEFRLRHLAADAPVRRCLEVAARLFGYQPAKPPSRRGYGVALGTDAGTWVAHLAEVAVDRQTGKVQVKRVVCAQDMGRAINPEGARMQMEGCITMGLGYALGEEVRFQGGEVRTRSFAEYPLPRFSDLPRIETLLVNPTEGAPQGGGEPAIICMGAVIANAIFDATGARLYHLPMTPERVLEALSKTEA
ncbi:MAG: xanthine dehydrogenase family protein molybdopterin-binding subunit [Armatimonadetes bacterium]|jgi:nicotinate dehydrogenase subunit B|nr:xanthine dehydrogenase family protein molybdopterin-binding subunit [Armatimonadota bacterium]